MPQSLPSITADTVDRADFRRAMGAFATGVTVVTAGGADAEMYGMTVNSFSSVSLDPLLVQVCLAASSRGLELIRTAGAFAINVLGEDQEYLSRWFASSGRPADSTMFDGIPLEFGASGCPALLDACAVFDCVVHQVVPAGDHEIVLGAVIGLKHEADVPPLVFHAGGYRSLEVPSAGRARLRVLPESA